MKVTPGERARRDLRRKMVEVQQTSERLRVIAEEMHMPERAVILQARADECKAIVDFLDKRDAWKRNEEAEQELRVTSPVDECSA